jgi:Carboxypeptidase regulatory-like domain
MAMNPGSTRCIGKQYVTGEGRIRENGSMRKSTMVAIAMIVGLFLLARGANGQDVRASLGGKVTDTQGAIVANATVSVTSDETGVVQITYTNASGDWIVLTLLPGHYHLEVKAPGFKTEDRTSIELQVGDKKYVDTQMQPGAVSQSVIVEATTPLIDITSAASGTVVTQAELDEIPTQSNAPTMDVAILPGVTVSGGVGGGVFLWSNASLSGTTVNAAGGGAQAIEYTMDGGVLNYNISGNSLAFEPPMDAVNQMRLVSNGYDASLGRESAGTEMLSLKSGQERFHGDLYEDNQGNYLNANSYQFDASHTPKAPIHVNEYGGSFGGPVWIPKLYDGRKKKTFFYFSYAGIRNLQPSDTGFSSLPTALERQGNFSQSFTVVSGVQYPIQIFNPYSSTTGTRLPYGPSETLPAPIDPIAAAYFALMPLPDLPPDLAVGNNANNFAKTGEQSDKFHGYTLRVDQTENNRNHTYLDLYYNVLNELSLTDFGTGADLPLDGRSQYRQNRGFVLDHDIALSENLLLDLHYNVMGYISQLFASGAGINPSTLGFPASFAGQMQKPSIPFVTGVGSNLGISGLGTDQAGGNAPSDINQDINVSMTWTHKNHNFHYGWEYMIQQESDSTLGDSAGTFAFGANWTSQYGTGAGTNGNGVGDAIADFDLGLPATGSSSTIPTNASAFYSQHYTALYFQDDWRVTPKLTLNLGLRWDFERPTTERFNRFFSQYNPTVPITPVTAAALPGYTAVYGGASAGSALLQQWGAAPGTFQVTGGPEYAGVNGTSRYETAPRYKYFQPRIGFAYQLLSKTVLRGGLGRFVQADFNPSANQTGFSSVTPFCPTACNNYDTVGQTWDNPYPQGLVQPVGNSEGILTNVGLPTGGTPTYTAYNIGRVYVDTATLAVQQQIKDYLIEVGGVFDATHGLAMQAGNNIDINVPSAGAWFAANTPTFDANDAPSPTLPGNTNLANPFENVQYVNAAEAGASTVTAYQLLRPNPAAGDIYLNTGIGRDFYYALNTKVEKRFNNGFGVLQSFAYSKKISEDDLYANQAVAVKIEKRLDTGDHRFNYSLAPIYVLPFGRGTRFLNHSGRALNELVGGWEVSGIYAFLSGVPVVLPTNSAFFEGQDPSLGSKKTQSHWFDTSKFAIFPSSNVTNATLGNTSIYPAWTGVTGMPGAGFSPTSSSGPQNGVYQDFARWNTYFPTTFGNVRQPYTTNFTLGLRKSFVIAGPVRFQMRMDLFNALNHPTFASVNTTVGNAFFGSLGSASALSQSNAPREVQLSGKLSF